MSEFGRLAQIESYFGGQGVEKVLKLQDPEYVPRY
jgi:hypothetical protein